MTIFLFRLGFLTVAFLNVLFPAAKKRPQWTLEVQQHQARAEMLILFRARNAAKNQWEKQAERGAQALGGWELPSDCFYHEFHGFLAF